MIAARIRLLHKGSGADQIARIMAFLNKTLDSYVHGAYLTAMELFTGETYTFMIAGHESLEKRSVAKNFVAQNYLRLLLLWNSWQRTRNLPDLVREIATDRPRLMESGESS